MTTIYPAVIDALVRRNRRLHYQLAQMHRDEQPSDVINMRQLSALARSLIGQALREIAGVQTRMANVSHTTSPSS